VGVIAQPELHPLTDERDPDDWRPRSQAAFLSDADASLAAIVEELAIGDRIPLHVHAIDEVLCYERGTAEVRVGELTQRVGAGATLFVPAGLAHTTVNVGDEPVRLTAVFPSHVVDIRYLERVPAPGTEGDEPGPPVAYDIRTGDVLAVAVEPVKPAAPAGSVFPHVELRPMTREGNPDDWRPRSRAGVVTDRVASLAVAVQEVAPGDTVPLHVHAIDEVFCFERGTGELRIRGDADVVAAGAVAFVAAGVPHALRNTGADPLRFRAVFPSHLIDLRYLERNPAPGTEGQEPQPGIVYDARTREVRAGAQSR
jgi:quercetin dioxygenase-like cupin family protein